jgi:hypothetical protein
LSQEDLEADSEGLLAFGVIADLFDEDLVEDQDDLVETNDSKGEQLLKENFV